MKDIPMKATALAEGYFSIQRIAEEL